MKLIHKIGAVVGSGAIVALGLGAASAVPAFASCPTGSTTCANVSVTVPASISLSNVSPTIVFPPLNGTVPETDIAGNAENEVVTTNNTDGYTLSLQANASDFVGNSNGNAIATTIPDTNLTIGDLVNHGQPSAGPETYQTFGTGATPSITLYTSAGPSSGIASLTGGTGGYGDQFNEDWELAINSVLPSASFTETFTYTAQATQ